MKTCIIKNLFLLPVLIAGLGLMLAGRVTAQTFTTLYSFTATPPYPGPYINSDGAIPAAGLLLSGNTLYGTALIGGSGGSGTVFGVNTDGTGFTTIYSFTSTPVPPCPCPNSDGDTPLAGLILSGNTLYGTAERGGSSDSGTVFAVNTDGTGFTTLYSFTALSYNTNSDGASPEAALLLSSNALYGTAGFGGSSGWGTVFAVNTDGTGFTNLHTFTGGRDGGIPYAGFILSGNTLYGNAGEGGSSYGDQGRGTVFAVNTDGTGFTTLHSFTALSYNTNSDGYSANGLMLSGNTLYGTAQNGGSSGNGTVFKVNTDGTGFTTLHSFTAETGRNSGDFPINSDGAQPHAGLILSGNTLYGTTVFGGSSGNGTIFSLSLPPPRLTITFLGADVILTWPTNAAGFSLQSTTNLVSPAVWTTVSPAPVIVNGQNTVTNPISGTQQFYRLSQ